MSKGKLEKFAELKDFENTIEIPEGHIIEEHPLKGNWTKEHFKNDNPIVLELGCGKGEYTVNLAKAHPLKNFIGVDIKGNRIWHGAKAAIDAGLNNVAFIRIRIDHITKVFDANEVSEIWVTFPDPQPQQKREKKRLTSMNFLEKYRPMLQKDAIIHLKTDNYPLYEYTLEEVVKPNNLRLIDATANLYGETDKVSIDKETLGIKTFYERMFLEKGMNICYLSFRL